MACTSTNCSVLGYNTAFVSDYQRDIFTLFGIVILGGCVSILGCVANVINMAVFYKQRLDSTINISFFSLALSDFCCLLLQVFYSLTFGIMFLELELPIVFIEFIHLTTGVPRVMFARITCQITAFITAERCLCVVLPLHVKRIITPRVTRTVITAIYTLTFITLAPLYMTSYIYWKFYLDLNTTLLGITYTEGNDISHAFVYSSHAFFTLAGYLLVLIFTLVIIIKLQQKNEWRQSIGREKEKDASKRDRGTIKMVVVIACISVVCYTPAFFSGITSFLEPEFSISGIHHNLYVCLWNLAFLLEDMNSSANIFLYYKMSSKFRQTFREFICKV